VYDIISRRKVFYLVSGAIILVGLISLATRGLNLGIDFTSGSLLQLQFDREVTVAEIYEVLSSDEVEALGVTKSSVRVSGDRRTAMVTINPISRAAEAELLDVIANTIGAVELLSSDRVDPIVGGELVRKAIIALALSAVGILVYVSLRFEPRFAGAGVMALIHDVLVVLTVFSVFQVEVNSPFIAGILTVIGYSINATIVVFDRIRENMAKGLTNSLEELANISVNQTLKRCLYTSLTTAFTAGALHFLGAASIRDLTLSFLIGLVAGTYSSTCVAAGMWLDLREWSQRRAVAAR
jgi:preprotein translocase subunit SecF